MSLLRRALGRKEVLIALLVFLVAGGWLGWRLFMRPAQAEVLGPELSQLRGLLDAGQYAAAVAQADALLAQTAVQPTVLRYKCLAQHLLNDPQADATADATLAAASTGPDAAVALAVKALEALRYERLEIAAAKGHASQALQQAGDDPMAGFLARLALAVAVRCEADPANLVALTTADPGVLAGQAAQIRQTLEPVLTAQPALPAAVWEQKLWRWTLALATDAGILATEAGDPAGEAGGLATMQRSCPEDVWVSYFGIPDKALAAARQSQPVAGTFDDHARVAMYTAAGYLYAQSGDRMHCDVLFRRGIQAYGRLLEAYDGWDGPQTDTVSPRGVFKNVGAEFYDYRNRMERLAKYSADWWGMRAVQGRVDLATAVSASDHRVFRAIVRLRADTRTNPILVMYEEQIRPPDYLTVADWFATRPYAPQAEWEHERAALLEQVGREEVALEEGRRQAHPLVTGGQLDEAIGLLARLLDPPPTLAATRVQLHMQLADLLFRAQRFAEIPALLEPAAQAVMQGDAYLGPCRHPSALRQIQKMRVQATRWAGNLRAATALAESLRDDPAQPLDVQLQMLAELVGLYSQARRDSDARQAFEQLGALGGSTPQFAALRERLLPYAQTALDQAPVPAQADQ